MVDMNFAAVDRGGEYLQARNRPGVEESRKRTATSHWRASVRYRYGQPHQRTGRRPDSGEQVRRPRRRHMASGARPLSRKPGVANFVPNGITRNCIQCNKCSFVCPQRAIRPFVLNEDRIPRKERPSKRNIPSLPWENSSPGMRFVQQVDVLDCTGWRQLKPTYAQERKEQSLTMKHIEKSQLDNQRNWDYCRNNVSSKADLVDVSPQHEELPVRDAAV